MHDDLHDLLLKMIQNRDRVLVGPGGQFTRQFIPHQFQFLDHIPPVSWFDELGSLIDNL